MSEKVVLEKVILKNFNSFQNDEVILDPGFNIVTGPNGAGKSTIFQAIKFGLGSNEKDGRYNKWSDFIRINEQSGSVELQIRKAEEFYYIRRIMFKNSTPYYQIKLPNDKKFHNCNVKKIHHLAKTLGYNPDNIFAFVSQGNITAIKSMKKHEVCRFLELGLGLTEQKHEIFLQKERIVNLTHQIKSLESMKDSATHDLELLQPKLRKLEQKIKLEDERNHLEKERLWLNKNKMKVELEELRGLIQEKTLELAELDKKKEILTEKISEFNNSIESLSLDIDTKNEEIIKVSAERSICEEKIKKWQEGKDNVADRILKLKSSLKSFDAELNRNTGDLDLIKQEISKYELELEVVNANIEDLMDSYKKNDKIRQKNQELMKKYDELKEVRNSISLEFHKTQTNLESIETKINEKMSDIGEFSKNLEKYKWFLNDPEKNNKKNLELKLAKFENGVEKIKQNLSNLEFNNKKYEQELGKIKSSVLMKEAPKSQAMLNLIKDIQDRNIPAYGPIIDIIKFDSRMGPAVDAIFNNFTLNSFIALNKDTFLLVDTLIKKHKVKCNVYQPLKEQIKEYRKISVDKQNGIYGYLSRYITPLIQPIAVNKLIASICRNTVLVKDKSIGIDLILNAGHKGNIVTIDGEMIKKYAYVMESRSTFSGKKYENPAQQRKRISELQSNLEQNRKEIKELQIKKRTLEEKGLFQIRDYLKNIDSIEFTHRKKHMAINEKNALLQRKRIFVEDKNTYQSELEDLDRKIEDLQDQLPKDFQKIEEFMNQFHQTYAENEEKAKRINEILISKTKGKTNLEMIIQKLNTDKESNEIELEQLEKDLEENNAALLETMKRIAEIKDEIDDFERDIKETKQKINEFRDKTKNTNEKILLYRNKINRLEIRLEQDHSELYEKEQLIKEIEIDIKELGENYQPRTLVEVENDIKLITEKLRNYYDVSRELLTLKDHLTDTILSIAERKQEVTQEIMEAQETERKLEDEFKKVFLKHLEVIQDDINRRFDKVGINKKGRLQLSGEIDNLGVEIYVRFNESEERNLGTLSGGEQTMYSISLMLTLQDLNPSPLCIFDECQMFLDQQNSHEVSQLIKDATTNGSQFIIITPDATKTIIQLADRIIGIAKNGKEEASTAFEFPKDHFLGGLKSNG